MGDARTIVLARGARPVDVAHDMLTAGFAVEDKVSRQVATVHHQEGSKSAGTVYAAHRIFIGRTPCRFRLRFDAVKRCRTTSYNVSS